MILSSALKSTLCSVSLAVLLVSFFQTKGAEGSELISEIDILPMPKKMELSKKKFVLNDNGKPMAMITLDRDNRQAVIAAQEINDRIKDLGGQPLPMDMDLGKDRGRTSVMNKITLAVLQETQLGRDPCEVRETSHVISSKGEQGYIMRFCQEGEKDTAFLSGVGWQGLLHAGSTFRMLIKREGATIYATEAQIADWPDFKNRGLPVWPLPGSFEDFKKYVDWAFRYKFNRIYTYATRQRAADGYNLPTQEERTYLKRINNYAKERGIIINYALTWAIGTASFDGQNVAHKDAVTFNNQYYSWSDDSLLRKRAAEIAQFVKDTDAGSLHMHCIDTYEESWDDRGLQDRVRFGNNRSSADANVINIFAHEIRKINPMVELQFVVYPYHVNFDLPGNEKYKMWMKNLTDAIPRDIYFVITELNRNQTDSWIATTRQPLVHWINGNAFQWGRYFSTLPAFTKTSYYEGRDRDIIVHMEPIGHFSGEVMQLVAAEYEWNVGAPGSGYIMEEKTGRINGTGGNLYYRKEMVNSSDVNSRAWFEGTAEPKPTTEGLLLRACRLEFGEEAAPFMVDFFKNNPIGWRSSSLFSQVLHDVMPEKELEASRDQLKKTEKALLSLKKALNVLEMNNTARERVMSFLKNTYRQNFTISAATTYYQAKELSMKGFKADALATIENGRKQLEEIRREMERNGYWSNEVIEWFEEGNSKLKTAECGLKKDASMNLIKNPGFEERLNFVGHERASIPRWSTFGSLDATQDSHSGGYAARLQLKPSDKFVFMEQALDVAPGCEGYVEFWLKKDGAFRAIPVLQYWNAAHTTKIEDVAIKDFPFNTAVQDYVMFNGKFHLPPHVKQVVFKLYADWYGSMPIEEKNLYLDDVFVSCHSDD